MAYLSHARLPFYFLQDPWAPHPKAEPFRGRGGCRQPAGEGVLGQPRALWELLLPGTKLLLTSSKSGGRLPYAVLACRKKGCHVLLHTHLTNSIVRSLIKSRRLPPYAGCRVISAEPAWGRHRFDLLLQHRQSGRRFYLEIKT